VPALIGTMVDVEITEAQPHSLRGVLLSTNPAKKWVPFQPHVLESR